MAAADINTEAAEPKSISTDGMRAEEHSIKDKVEADRYGNSAVDGKKKTRGIALSQFQNQGAVR